VNNMKIGVVGYGNLGQYLVDEILRQPDLTLAFVWNRTKETLTGKVHHQYIIQDIQQISHRDVDLIVEVAHPSITQAYGAFFLQHADYLMGSPTALAAADVEQNLRAACSKYNHGLYIPVGALWGGEDVRRMADRGKLQKLRVTMAKHPSCFKLHGDLKEKNDRVTDTRTVLYDGPVRELCPLAPNNVNTMAAAALAAHNLGMDKVEGCLVADPQLSDWHVVEVETWGPGDMQSDTAFHVHTVRRNPAKLGVVTGNATYAAFVSSMLDAHGKGAGIHLC